MSNDGSASLSDSSNSSSSQLSFFQDNAVDLTLFGSPAPTFVRSGTVVRRAAAPVRKDRIESTSSTEDDDTTPSERYRREPQYRHSLAAISERRSARNSLSNESGKSLRRMYNSVDSSPAIITDYLTQPLTGEHNGEKYLASPTSSSYLSWIESVKSHSFGSAISNSQAEDADTKVGEWNNFWLNYSNARLRQLSTEQTFSSDGADGTADAQSDDEKSQGSTQRDVTDKNSVDCVTLTIEEMQETIKCSQRITEILQNAMKRSEVEGTSNESYYSQQVSGQNSIRDDVPPIVVNRERSTSCVDSQTLQRQKQNLKPTQQSSSTSCIDAILNTGVADILKRVISKRRDVIGSESESRTATRSSFSEWSTR